MADQSKLTLVDHVNKNLLASFKTHLDSTKPINATDVERKDDGEWSDDDENARKSYAEEINERNPENVLTSASVEQSAATSAATTTNGVDDDDPDDKLPPLEERNVNGK